MFLSRHKDNEFSILHFISLKFKCQRILLTVNYDLKILNKDKYSKQFLHKEVTTVSYLFVTEAKNKQMYFITHNIYTT